MENTRTVLKALTVLLLPISFIALRWVRPGDSYTLSTLPPEEIVAFAWQRLAYFKVPRYIEYVDDLLSPAAGPTDHKRITVTVSCAAGSVELVTVVSNY